MNTNVLAGMEGRRCSLGCIERARPAQAWQYLDLLVFIRTTIHQSLLSLRKFLVQTRKLVLLPSDILVPPHERGVRRISPETKIRRKAPDGSPSPWGEGWGEGEFGPMLFP